MIIAYGNRRVVPEIVVRRRRDFMIEETQGGIGEEDMLRLMMGLYLDRVANVLLPSGECLLWTGWIKQGGYGEMEVLINRRAFAFPVHRMVLQVGIGRLLKTEEMACHRCDTPGCCNIQHLFAGTALDNSNDMIAKGRAKNSHLFRTKPMPHGADHFHSKLTDAKVVQIRERAAAGEGLRSISRDLGLHHTTVMSAVRRETWKHVK